MYCKTVVKKRLNINFHTKNIEQTFSILETDHSGLTKETVNERQEKYGLNILPSKSVFNEFLGSKISWSISLLTLFWLPPQDKIRVPPKTKGAIFFRFNFISK